MYKWVFAHKLKQLDMLNSPLYILVWGNNISGYVFVHWLGHGGKAEGYKVKL